MAILPGSMTGTHYVRAVRPAFQDARKWLPKMSDRAELRRQALKLRFWGADGEIQDYGVVVDMNWCWVKALRDLRIGELRIDDTIGGNNNLRLITWHPQQQTPPSWHPAYGDVPHIWILSVFQKKRDDFTSANIDNFKARKLTVIERFYKP
jgi:hypothetical protein